MKNQALFSLKDKSKKLKCLLLQFLFRTLRVNMYHHHHQIFDQRADIGDISTTVGPLPGNWLAARMADLTPDLQVSLS